MLNIQFTKPTLVQKCQFATRTGYVITQDSLLRARAMIVDCLQGHPLDFTEVSWDGSRFRILPDEET